MKKTFYYFGLILLLLLAIFLKNKNIETKEINLADVNQTNTNGNFYVGYGIRDISPLKSNYTKEELANKNMPIISECDSKNTLGNGVKAINPLPLQGYGNAMGRAKETQCIDKDSHIKTTVVAIKDNNDYVILLSADFVAFYSTLSNNSGFTVSEIRNSIVSYVKKELGITVKANRIMLSSTHNHSAPSFMYDSDNIRAYDNFAKRQINEAVKEALSNMKKADISYDTLKIFLDSNGNVTSSENYTGIKKYLAYIRHYKTNNYVYLNKKPVVTSVGRGIFGLKCTDGTYTKCNETWSKTELVGHTREPDYDMQVLKIQFSDKSKPILMLNFQAHPVNQGSAQRVVITADFIGYLRGYLENKGYLISYYQGAAGDANTYTRITSDSFKVNGESIMTLTYSDASDVNAKKAVKIIGSKIGEIVDTRIKSGNFFKKKVEYKNGIVFYQEKAKSEYESNKIKMYVRNWKNKDSNGNYIYNVETYANAFFISKFNSAAEKDYNTPGSNDLKRIINGEYTLNEWKKDWDYKDQSGKVIPFKFPKLMGNTPEEVGKKLVSIIMQYNNDYFYSMFKFEKNSQGVYKLSGYTRLNVSIIAGLVNPLLGTMLDDLSTPTIDESICNNSHTAIIKSIYNRKEEYWNPILNAFAIGNIGFVTAPYEMFSSNGKYIKTNSPYDMTFVLAYSNGGYYGYLPDKESFKYKSYETDITLFVEGTAENNATTLVNRLKDIYNNPLRINDTNTTISNTNIFMKIPYNFSLTEKELEKKITLAGKNALIKNSSGKIITSNSDILGTGSKISLNNKEYNLIINGDVNKDGKISTSDYIEIRKHLLSIKEISNNKIEFNASDLSKDGKISTIDYIELRKIILEG